MNTTELLAVFREEVFDLTAPYLWSDALVYRYIDDAQKQFCRDTYGIADARNHSLSTSAGVEWYDLDPRILKIRGATEQATGRSVIMVPAEKTTDQHIRFDGAFGPIKAFVTGLEKNVLRAWPMPNQTQTVTLSVFRLPTSIASGDDFEIDEQHVLPLLFWVKHKAYDVQDTEVFNPQASDKYRAKWDAYCAKALNEQSRASHVAGTVIYGGV